MNSTWNKNLAHHYLPSNTTHKLANINSPKKIRFWPSTDIIDAASLEQIVSNSGQDEVITRSLHYQTLRMDKNSARNYSATKLVKKLMLTSINGC